jgi:hypothetical protein
MALGALASSIDPGPRALHLPPGHAMSWLSVPSWAREGVPAKARAAEGSSRVVLLAEEGFGREESEKEQVRRPRRGLKEGMGGRRDSRESHFSLRERADAMLLDALSQSEETMEQEGRRG